MECYTQYDNGCFRYSALAECSRYGTVTHSVGHHKDTDEHLHSCPGRCRSFCAYGHECCSGRMDRTAKQCTRGGSVTGQGAGVPRACFPRASGHCGQSCCGRDDGYPYSGLRRLGRRPGGSMTMPVVTPIGIVGSVCCLWLL
ncbi:hypothetical protein BU25DRAFT_134923 [Macroventuria anomochaeta]|uniref:Uncharacterized protein n=1 Tax=Macroventuria anomochaeta TaxID=301207 RepID=A0ACB6RSZ4_9PLEO|nr:uncharacterized protein BU25DRAFT_134923 [Macroventuria anomochaeta]KAF2624827.1 hypothetical protein BU25DRAFT_134923 [Macroventuria anomochaeta]